MFVFVIRDLELIDGGVPVPNSVNFYTETTDISLVDSEDDGSWCCPTCCLILYFILKCLADINKPKLLVSKVLSLVITTSIDVIINIVI